MNEEQLFARIAPLFDVGMLADARVMVAGCGSGGSQVALQLAMSGIRHFALFDRDILEPENVIRHACGGRYLGQRKVDALADVLLDRNPKIQVHRFDADLASLGDLEHHIQNADVVVLATDNDVTRFRINELCVQTQTPFVVGRVFTRGIGGEVFAFRPGEGGCLACLESKLERTQFRDGIHEIDLISEQEGEKLYGLDVKELKDSPGLNVDISFITCFHARFVLDSVVRTLTAKPKGWMPIDQNYVVWGNRPVRPFSKHFEIQRIGLHAQEGCLVCGVGATKCAAV